MSDFVDLKSLYEHLEEKAIDYDNSFEIANLFIRICDRMPVDKKMDLKLKAQWEVAFFYFSLTETGVQPFRKKTDHKGNLVTYPNFDSFKPETYTYLEERLTSTTNPLLKARYAHILWLSPKKHGKYAETAIDAYLKLIVLYEQKDKESPSEFYGLDVIHSLVNAWSLSRMINDVNRIDICKKHVLRLLFDFNQQSTSLFKLRVDLAELMLKEKTFFSKIDLAGITELFFNFSRVLGHSHVSITILDLGQKIDKRLDKVSYKWDELIAESYEKTMFDQIDKNNHVALEFCMDALERYRKTKNSSKISELEIKYKELKGSLTYKKIEIKPTKRHIKACEKRAKEIATKYSSEQILSFLMQEESLLPTYDLMEKLAQERSNSLYGVLQKSTTDSHGHTSQRFTSNQEIERYEILHQYKITLITTFLPLIDLIIIESLKEKKLTFLALTDFLKKYSFIGKTISLNIQNQKVSYNWLGFVAPSLLDYFNEMDYFFASGAYPNLILSIDSLTLKIEGLLRDLISAHEAVTFHPTKEPHIYREDDLNKLLYSKKICDLFSRDELLFFRFVLVEKAGYNMRHNIAHALTFSGEYQVQRFHLLLLMLLKIGKYDFGRKPDITAKVKRMATTRYYRS